MIVEGAAQPLQPSPSRVARQHTRLNIHTSSESPWWVPAAAACTSPADGRPYGSGDNGRSRPPPKTVGPDVLVSAIDISERRMGDVEDVGGQPAGIDGQPHVHHPLGREVTHGDRPETRALGV